jgi:hypothetical protein
VPVPEITVLKVYVTIAGGIGLAMYAAAIGPATAELVKFGSTELFWVPS